jgi:hypothetical protein
MSNDYSCFIASPVLRRTHSVGFRKRQPGDETVHIAHNVRLIGAEDVVVGMSKPDHFCRRQALLEGFGHGSLKSEVTLVCFRSLGRISYPALVWERVDCENRRVDVRILLPTRGNGVLDRDNRALRPRR